jgi:hypothetical protein
MDHSGAALRLSQENHALIYAHKKSTILDRHRRDLWERIFQFLMRCAMPEELMRRAYETFRSSANLEDREARPYGIEWLNGEESIEVNGLSLQVIATPGHSPDHLCFYETNSGTLFCGDTLIKHITPNPTLHLDLRTIPEIAQPIRYIKSPEYRGAEDCRRLFRPRRRHHRRCRTDRTTPWISSGRETLFLARIRRGPWPYPLARVFGKLDRGQFGA